MSVRTHVWHGPRVRYLALMATVAVALALVPLVGMAQPEPVDEPNDACPDEANPPAPFLDRLDIPEVHRLNVDCAFNNDITQGYGDQTFRPRVIVPRDQFASFMVRTLEAAGVDVPAPSDQGFTDIEGNTHEDNINILAQTGITEGTTATTYSPSLRLRRDQVASFVLRAVAYIEDVPLDRLQRDTGPFTDVPPSNVHAPNINGARDLNLTIGRTANTYEPAIGTRRDQMASFLVRLLAAIQNGGLVFPEDRAETLELTPETDTNPTGSDHTLTATVRDEDAAAVEGANVHFQVYRDDGSGTFSGPEETEATTTNADGEAVFTYTGPAAASSDVIVACAARAAEPCVVTDEQSGTSGTQFTGAPEVESRVADTATKEWVDGGSGAPAESLIASAYGLDVALVGEGAIEQTPFVEVQMPPPDGQEEQTDELLEVPASPLTEIGALRVAARGDLPGGVAQGEAEATEVELLMGVEGAQEPLITADAVHAVSTATCPGPDTLEEAAEGTQFVNLTIAGNAIPVNVSPNFAVTIPGVAEVVVNEVIEDPREQDRGHTVRGLRVTLLQSIPEVGEAGAEIIVAEAHSGITCAAG